MRLKEFSKTIWFTLIVVTCYALAMAFLESAVVIYLRALFGINGEWRSVLPDSSNTLMALPFFAFLQPHYLLTILPDSQILGVDLFRELATIVMIAAVSWLSGQTRRQKFAFFLYIFGIWDIFYYVFLYLILDWPASLKTLDVLFLIPVPWVAPVFVPIGVSVLMILSALILINPQNIFYKNEKKILEKESNV